MSATAVSATLIQEEDRKQLPVYYVSQAFQGVKAKYPCIEKIAFALIVASRKLHPYFQVNPISVKTNQPIKKSMNKPEAVRSMIQRVIELIQFDIEYHPRTTIKAQALADFITEFTILDEEVATNKVERWTIQTDGFQTGYFWPTLQKDAKEFVKKCDKCQRFGNVQRIPFEKLMTIASPWPFAQWGLDIIGPLP